MKRSILFFILFTGFLTIMKAQSPTVFISGTITNISNGSPIADHLVYISADSSSGFFFFTTRTTSVNGTYDCSIQNVPTNDTVRFYVSTYDCQNYMHQETVLSIHAQNVVDFSICDNSGTECQANFEYYADSTNANTFHFISTSTPANLITSLLWDFGDGSPHATTHDPWHTFPTNGYYMVCLTITTSNACTSTHCDTISVGQNTGCQASFQYYADSANIQTFHFYSTSTPANLIASYAWNFGDGSQVVTTSDPWHTYATYGTYTVCLTIITTTNCTSTYCESVTVGQGGGCHAQFTFYTDSLNAGSYVYHFIDQSTGNPAHWYWNFGDPSSGTANTSTLQNPAHTFSVNGTYMVCLTISGNNCQDATCDSLSVGGNPTNCENSFTYTKNFLTVNFEGHTNSPYFTNYLWNFGDPASGNSNSSLLQNPTHVYSTAGSYIVTLTTVDSTSCTWSRTETIWVSGTCDLYGYVIAENSYVDHGFIQLIRVDSNSTMTVVDTKDIGDSIGMYWFGGVTSGHYYLKAELLPTSIYYGQYAPTYYIQSITWGNANLIELGTVNNPYNINMVPTVDLPSGNGTIHGTINQNLKVNGSGGPVANVEVLLLNGQDHPFAYTKTNQNGEFAFDNIALGTYTVYPEDAGKATSPAHITLDNTNSSANLSFNMHEGSIIFGIQDPLPQFISGISDIYPNPPVDVANISITATKDVSLQVSIYNMTGQLIQELPVVAHKGQNRVTFGTSTLSNGFYYLKVSSEDGSSMVRKFIKSR